ncbi:MAG: hypothetical protein IKK34_13855 [Clostridia bacterium]|nr:hypothetical protein [Clostridia bacterium]
MGRRFCAVFLAAALMVVPAGPRGLRAQPVFFSMLFPQLIPPCLYEGEEATAGEAMML